LLDSALQESMATRNIVTNAVVIALSAMHPYLHPALRPPWNLRMRITRVAQNKLVDTDAREALVGTAAATKEAVRRMLASTMCAAPAMQAGFAHVSHPAGLLLSPPLNTPARGMEGAMTAFVHAGMRMALELESALNTPPREYSSIVNAAFSAEGDAKAMEWDAPWLGTHLITFEPLYHALPTLLVHSLTHSISTAGKGTSSTHQKVPLVTVASDLWAVAFRANFIVFWGHCMSKSIRASRLDAVQHRAIHGLNAATKLTLQLTERQQLQAQRLALSHRSAGLLTIEEAAGILGIEGVKGTSSNGGAKNAQDALVSISAAGAEAAARLLAFARAAWVSEEILVVELGGDTKHRQLRALYKRLGRTDYDRGAAGGGSDLPVHATHLHACVECHRIANAFAMDGSKQSASFNELGTSSSMLCTVCTGEEEGTTHIRCAKRSSAALRTALAFEEVMKEKQVEYEPANAAAVTSLLSGSGAANGGKDDAANGVAARVRRDAKNALEQQATALACGERPMVRISMVGRAVRLWNDWFALCSFCGAMLRVLPQNRYGAEICCLKCDAQMLGLAAPAPPERKVVTCRYCNLADPERRASRWKTLKAPLDMSGDNAMLPVRATSYTPSLTTSIADILCSFPFSRSVPKPPMRTVAYCTKHFRSWLVGAHRVLPTRIILSHIAHNAKPIYSSGASTSRTAAELGFEAPPKTRKRRRAQGPREEGVEPGD
jgi:hypothetical protein